MNKTTFTQDASGRSLLVKREFASSLKNVWRAWTESDLLEQWWAPDPFTTHTVKMDFREGGYWHYYMQGPDNAKFWARLDYQKIEPQKRYKAIDSFCDEAGVKSNDFPNGDWDTMFTSNGTTTVVTVTLSFATAEDLQKIISVGFKEGFSSAHDNLDKFLAKW